MLQNINIQLSQESVFKKYFPLRDGPESFRVIPSSSTPDRDKRSAVVWAWGGRRQPVREGEQEEIQVAEQTGVWCGGCVADSCGGSLRGSSQPLRLGSTKRLPPLSARRSAVLAATNRHNAPHRGFPPSINPPRPLCPSKPQSLHFYGDSLSRESHPKQWVKLEGKAQLTDSGRRWVAIVLAASLAFLRRELLPIAHEGRHDGKSCLGNFDSSLLHFPELDPYVLDHKSIPKC